MLKKCWQKPMRPKSVWMEATRSYANSSNRSETSLLVRNAYRFPWDMLLGWSSPWILTPTLIWFYRRWSGPGKHRGCGQWSSADADAHHSSPAAEPDRRDQGARGQLDRSRGHPQPERCWHTESRKPAGTSPQGQVWDLFSHLQQSQRTVWYSRHFATSLPNVIIMSIK